MYRRKNNKWRIIIIIPRIARIRCKTPKHKYSNIQLWLEITIWRGKQLKKSHVTLPVRSPRTIGTLYVVRVPRSLLTITVNLGYGFFHKHSTGMILYNNVFESILKCFIPNDEVLKTTERNSNLHAEFRFSFL